jgi:hypothetical protein
LLIILSCGLMRMATSMNSFVKERNTTFDSPGRFYWHANNHTCSLLSLRVHSLQNSRICFMKVQVFQKFISSLTRKYHFYTH